MNDETEIALPSARAVLDAGGETWATLVEVIGRRIEELAGGAILEIVALEPSICANLPGWCGSAGHEVIHRLTEGDVTRFWIRKS